MSEEELAGLERLRAAGSPGKWYSADVDPQDGRMVCAPDDADPGEGWHLALCYNLAGYVQEQQGMIPGKHNAALIAAAVNALPALLADSRRADECEALLADACDESRLALKAAEDERAAILGLIHAHVGTLDAHHDRASIAYHLGQVAAAIMGVGAEHPKQLPHLQARRRLARLEASCRALLACWPDDGGNLTEWVNARRDAVRAIREALSDGTDATGGQ